MAAGMTVAEMKNMLAKMVAARLQLDESIATLCRYIREAEEEQGSESVQSSDGGLRDLKTFGKPN